MAETSLITENLNQMLECAICMEPYRDPRVLPCHHGFCKDCLEQLVCSSEDQRTLVCPTCRKTLKLPKGGVKNLPVHFYLSSLQDTVAMITKTKVRIHAMCTSH